MMNALAAIFFAFALTSPNSLAYHELNCLAKNVYFEARGEPDDGKLAVAIVTLNRARDKQFPNSICEVVYQNKQFNWTFDGKSDVPKNKKAWKKSVEIALKAIYNKDSYNKDILFFHAAYSSPYWKTHFQRVMKIGNHIFYARNGTTSTN